MNNGWGFVTAYLWYVSFFLCDPAVNVHVMENKNHPVRYLIPNQPSFQYRQNVIYFSFTSLLLTQKVGDIFSLNYVFEVWV